MTRAFRDIPHRRPLGDKLVTSLQKRRLWLHRLTGGSRTITCGYFGARFVVDLDEVIGYEVAIRRFEWRELKLMMDACQRLEPDCFIDVGANIGLYTCVLARAGLVPKVFAFEPDRENFARLKANIALNAVDAIVGAQQAAAAARPGMLRLLPADRFNRGMSRIAADSIGGYEVPAVALDEVVTLRDAVIALKIDVEGFEAEVLSGAAQLLATNRGFAQIEAREDAAAAMVTDRMTGFGWRFLDRHGLDLRFEKP